MEKSYYKNCAGILFVFDYSVLLSFENISEWIKEFEENNSDMNIPKYLVGNKCDLDNIVTQEKIDKFLQDTNYKFKKTSAATGLNIDELFQELAEDIWENFLKTEDKSQKMKLISHHIKEKKQSSCICEPGFSSF